MNEEMMSSLDFGKSVDDIEAPVLMPEGWYDFEIGLPAPRVTENTAKREDPTDEKAGDNWTVNVNSVHDEAIYNGRRFTIWLGIPEEKNKEQYTRDGQRMYDWKMQRIADFTSAFEGELLDGPGGPRSKPMLRVGGKGRLYVLQQIDQRTQELVNQIDNFAKPKKVEGDDPLL